MYEDETGFVVLTLYVDDFLFLSASKTLLRKLKKQLVEGFQMFYMGNVSRILGMNATRDREKGAITISQKGFTEDVVQHYGMKGFNLAYTLGVGPELSLNQPEEKLLHEEKRRYQVITGAVMYLAQITRYDILYAVDEMTRAMSKPAKAHMGAAKCPLRYLDGFTDFSITYKQGGFRFAALSSSSSTSLRLRTPTSSSSSSGRPSSSCGRNTCVFLIFFQ